MPGTVSTNAVLTNQNKTEFVALKACYHMQHIILLHQNTDKKGRKRKKKDYVTTDIYETFY